jgi:hypothetical protein
VLDFLRVLLGLASDLIRRRVGLAAENLLLRQQLIVAERKIAGRVRWTPWQRLTIVLAARFAPAWREATLLIKPATMLRWHRAGFRALWRTRSRRLGRPPTPRAALIREMATRNPLWGAERIRGELLKLGITVCKRTVQRYMGRRRRQRTELVYVPAEPRDVGLRFRADIRCSVSRDLRTVLSRPASSHDRSSRGASSSRRVHESCGPRCAR